jgi:hypothetical protein
MGVCHGDFRQRDWSSNTSWLAYCLCTHNAAWWGCKTAINRRPIHMITNSAGRCKSDQRALDGEWRVIETNPVCPWTFDSALGAGLPIVSRRATLPFYARQGLHPFPWSRVGARAASPWRSTPLQLLRCCTAERRWMGVPHRDRHLFCDVLWGVTLRRLGFQPLPKRRPF